MSFQKRFLFGAALVFGVGGHIAAQEPAAPATNVHSELLHLLKADAKAGSKAAAPKMPAAKAAAASAAPVAPPAPLWDYFTDTGILKSARGKKVTTELTFGPCTDGELLNQRYFW